MASLKSKFVIYGAIVLVVVAALALFVHFKKNPLAGSKDFVTLEQDAAYFDWNLSKSDLAKSNRDLVTTPLIELGPEGRVYPLLAKRILLPMDNTALIELRESAYWSDGALFKAQQLVDAHYRVRKSFQDEKLTGLTEQEKDWLRYNLQAKEDNVLEVRGFKNEADLHAFLTSWMLAPIRVDLIDKNPTQAFEVVLGPYKPEKIADPKQLSAQTVLKYQPNLYYYGGAPKKPTTLSLSKMSEKKTNQ
jgi:hypothetical protein